MTYFMRRPIRSFALKRRSRCGWIRGSPPPSWHPLPERAPHVGQGMASTALRVISFFIPGSLRRYPDFMRSVNQDVSACRLANRAQSGSSKASCTSVGGVPESVGREPGRIQLHARQAHAANVAFSSHTSALGITKIRSLPDRSGWPPDPRRPPTPASFPSQPPAAPC
jgi:hypothetical protein